MEQVQANDLKRSRPKQTTSLGEGPNDLFDSRATTASTERAPEMPSDLWSDRNHDSDCTTKINHLSLGSTGTWKIDHQRHSHNYTNESRKMGRQTCWNTRGMKNQSVEIVFILLGLTDDPQLQILIFLFLFINYILSLMGNLVIILLTLLDPRLKTPMYFFLRNFSFLEMAFTSSCIPRFLMSILTGDKTISYGACLTQLFFFFLLLITEFYLLAAMSYDRYVAICRPLHYPIIMNSKVCHLLVISSW
ncbi:hypothetical protein U0070_006374 [Myodes glareolus]|uniref:Olfactory receptor n=1 Tax=Myodes glareolus TaxID=447135 RepID=A0AAW0HZF8_MYOGA